jgi:hypothetical protein
MTTEAMGRLSASPPWSSGLSRKSPTVAPRGRVRINVAQNSEPQNIRPEIGRCNHRQSDAKCKCPAHVSEPRICNPITESSS